MPTTGYTQTNNGLWYKTNDQSGPYSYGPDGNMYLVSAAGNTGASATQVQGTAASGAAPVGNPVLVAGTDGGTGARILATNSVGNLAVAGNVSSGAADSGAPVKVAGKYNTTLPTFTDGQRTDLQVGSRGSLNVTLRSIDGSGGPAILDNSADARTDSTSGLVSDAFGYIRNGTAWDRLTKATSTSRITSSAGSNNATNAKSSAGNLHGYSGFNNNAAVRYLKFYNTSAAPTVGTDTPVLTVALAPSKEFQIMIENTRYFGTGLSYALVTGAADSDNTAVGAGDILGLNVIYS